MRHVEVFEWWQTSWEKRYFKIETMSTICLDISIIRVSLYTHFTSTREYIFPNNSIVFSRSFAIELTSLANARGNIRIEVYRAAWIWLNSSKLCVNLDQPSLNSKETLRTAYRIDPVSPIFDSSSYCGNKPIRYELIRNTVYFFFFFFLNRLTNRYTCLISDTNSTYTLASSSSKVD